MFPLRRHIAIQSECDIDCRLCRAIGCLHPHRRNVDEVRTEVDHALVCLSEFIVFPPNALEHPEIETIAALVHVKGLCPIFRTRPSQYRAGSLELILRLADRGARFELLMDRPSDPDIIDEIVALRKTRLRSLTPVLIPTRREDLSVAVDAIPLEWRRGLEVLPLLNADSNGPFLDSDELHEWLEKTRADGFRLKPYEEFDRTHPDASPEFNQPGEFEILCTHRRNEDAIRLSVVIPFQEVDQALAKTLASFTRQNSNPDTFELILVKDGLENKRSTELALKAVVPQAELNWSALILPDAAIPDTTIRSGLAMNNGALFGVGTQVAFLDPGMVVKPDWVTDAIKASASEPVAYRPHLIRADHDDDLSRMVPDEPRELALLDTHSRRRGVDWQALRTSCLAMPMKDFFDAGGFPRVFLTRSLEISALAWKLAHLGKPIAIRESGIDRLAESDERLKQPAPPRWKLFASSLRELEMLSPSATALYMMTLDTEVYRCYFGGQSEPSSTYSKRGPLAYALARVSVRWLSRSRFLRPLLEVAHFSFVVIRADNPFQFLVSSVITGSHQLVMGMKARLGDAPREVRGRRAK